MFKATVGVTVTNDHVAEMREALASLSDVEILVGIPESGDERQDGEIGNAQLAYIHTHGVRSAPMRAEMAASMAEGATYSRAHEMYLQEHGSPLWQVPPRPIIEPAIADPENSAILAADLKEAAAAALEGDLQRAVSRLKKTGIDAQNIVRDWFTNPKNGWAPNAPSTIERKGSENPLIDTGELRKTITYVIRGRRQR